MHKKAPEGAFVIYFPLQKSVKKDKVKNCKNTKAGVL